MGSEVASVLQRLEELGYDTMPAHGEWFEFRGPHGRVIGDSPLEVLGLVVLSAQQPIEHDEAYWWRVEGPDLYSDLITGDEG